LVRREADGIVPKNRLQFNSLAIGFTRFRGKSAARRGIVNSGRDSKIATVFDWKSVSLNRAASGAGRGRRLT
jgi:hypothetical protein